MATRLRFRWLKDLGDMISKNTRMERTLPQEADRQFRELSSDLQSYMRANAPWHDRTTRARSGLRAVYRGGGGSYVIELQHTAPYGKFLEFGTKFMDARPIIRPTLDSSLASTARRMGVVLTSTFGA